jgi:hypothetical protein
LNPPFISRKFILIIFFATEIFESGGSHVFQFDPKCHQHPIELMKDWRIDRFYIGKAKAFDMATHASDLASKK